MMTAHDISVSLMDRRIAGLAALAIGIHVLEAAFPSPVPGIKPGLANLVSLLAFLLYGFRIAVWVTLLRVVAGSIILGTFLSPTFVLSLGGALSVLLILGMVQSHKRYYGLSAQGIAVLCALMHTASQFALAYYLIVPHPGLLVLLPVLLSFALAFGLLNGMLTNQVYQRLNSSKGQIN